PPGSTKDAGQLVFREDLSYAALDAEGRELWAGTFDLDPSTTPKRWDHRPYESKENGADVLGIYEIDGDQLKVCCVVGVWKDGQWVGKLRPTVFDRSTVDVVLELRRASTDG
ncbi:MAG: TIGR03067 domain-containing protein, partial [Planctomycetaceae bacterium]